MEYNISNFNGQETLLKETQVDRWGSEWQCIVSGQISWVVTFQV